MSSTYEAKRRGDRDETGAATGAGTPGATTRTAALAPSGRAPVQRTPARDGAVPAAAPQGDDPFGLHLLSPVQRAGGDGAVGDDQVHAAAERGLSGTAHALPYLDTIQRGFGRHDVSGIAAHTDGAAAEAAASMGASAYATGNAVAFRGAPDLHAAAHEAAHVVQQRAGVSLKGGVGEAGDRYEQHADAVADAVVGGRSAEALLDRMAPGGGAAVQRQTDDAVQREIDPVADSLGGRDLGESPTGVSIGFATITPFPTGMVADHAWIAFDDGWSCGFTRLDGEPISAIRLHIPEPRANDPGREMHTARRKRDRVSQGKTSAEIKQQIKTYAETVDPGRYSIVGNNCGNWVLRALDQAWLIPSTPGRIY